MEEYVYWCIIAGLLLLLFIFGLILKRAHRSEFQAKKKLEDTVSNLEAVYSEVNTTQEELNAKYRELKASEDKIKKLAYEDNLTGLSNRAAFMELLEHTMSTLRKDESVAVMYIDLDDFKGINDRWGNACGDELLLDASHRLRKSLDDNDFLARYGSDEFVILSQNIENLSGYEEKVKRLQKSFHFPFVLSIKEFVISISIGIVIAPKNGKTASGLMKKADTALFKAKGQGKNSYCYFNESFEKKQIEDMEFKSDLAKAIKNNEFLVRYGRIQRLEDELTVGLHVDFYFNHPVKGLMKSEEFLPFSEETGQLLAIWDAVFQQICWNVADWMSQDMKPLTVAYPIYIRQFLDDGFEDIVSHALTSAGVPLSRFIFELSEKEALKAFNAVKEKMQKLTAEGYCFAIRDFGSGSLSFLSLNKLQVNSITMPVEAFEQLSQSDRRFMKSLVQVLAKMDIGYGITGLEDGIQEDLVREYGFSYVQGELYGGMMDAKSVPPALNGDIYGQMDEKQ